MVIKEKLYSSGKFLFALLRPPKKIKYLPHFFSKVFAYESQLLPILSYIDLYSNS